MDIERMASYLPTTAPAELVRWTRKNHSRALGDDLLVFCSERVAAPPPLEYLMENNCTSRKSMWMARCTCTACGEDFLTEKLPGIDGIRLVGGEDGLTYISDTGFDECYDNGTDCYYIDVINRESTLCPMCQSDVMLTHSKHLRGGRKNQLKVVEIRNIEGYTTILYWLVRRLLDEYGHPVYDAKPEDAYVLNERGVLIHYTRVYHGGAFYATTDRPGWQVRAGNRDTLDSIYHDWGSICNKKRGAVIYDVIPDMAGTTAEKTGLKEYLEVDGFWPVTYLKLWRKHKNVENLCVNGFARLVGEIIGQAERFCYQAEHEFDKYIDLKQRQPHKMLRISKEEFRQLRRSDMELTIGAIEDFRRYKGLGGKLTLPELMTKAPAFRNFTSVLDIMQRVRGSDIPKLERYCEKTGLSLYELDLLVDIHRIASKLYPGRALTAEELWPKHPITFHDRLVEIEQEEAERERSEKRKAAEAKFSEIKQRYADLEWSDGDLIIILPCSSQELKREGEVLRHCVGSYVNQHVSGHDTIFFVRHYRRPERPFYTLDINMLGQPVERQLHGYGNERHGNNKQYTHRIPKRVRDFCDKWKREVLLPWYAEQIKKGA